MIELVGLVLAAVGCWLGTAALLAFALSCYRDDEQDARLDALEREADAGLDELPAEIEPVEARPPIGFRRE